MLRTSPASLQIEHLDRLGYAFGCVDPNHGATGCGFPVGGADGCLRDGSALFFGSIADDRHSDF